MEEILEEIEKILKKKITEIEKNFWKIFENADPCSASYHFYSVTVPKIQKEVIQKCRAALKKIKGGTFGICENCKKEIPINRLKAVPSFEFCSPRCS